MTITRCRASSSGWLQHEQCSSGETGRSLFLKMSKKYISQTSNLLNLADEPTVKPFELNWLPIDPDFRNIKILFSFNYPQVPASPRLTGVTCVRSPPGAPWRMTSCSPWTSPCSATPRSSPSTSRTPWPFLTSASSTEKITSEVSLCHNHI